MNVLGCGINPVWSPTKPWQGYQLVSATWYQKTPLCLLGPAFSCCTLHRVPNGEQLKTTSVHIPSTSPSLSMYHTVSVRSYIWNALSFSCDLKWTKQMPFMPLNIVSLAGCSPNSDMENKFCRPQEHSIECKSLLHCYSAYLKRRSQIAAVFASFRGWSAECWGGKAQEGAWGAAHITPLWINMFSGNLKAATLEIVLGEKHVQQSPGLSEFLSSFLRQQVACTT